MCLSLFDRAKIIYIFTTFLPLPISGDGLVAVHFWGLLYADMRYLVKRKKQEGRELQTKEWNRPGRLKEEAGSRRRSWWGSGWLPKREKRELGGEEAQCSPVENGNVCRVPCNIIPVCCLFNII